MICFWTFQGCLQVVMEVVELGISGSKSREIPRVSNTTNQCGFTCTLNFWGKKLRRRRGDSTGLPPFDTEFLGHKRCQRKSITAFISFDTSLPADVLWGSFVSWGRNECVTNEPQRTSAGRLFWHSYPMNFSTKVSVVANGSPQLFFFRSLQVPFQIVNFLKIKTVLTNIFLLLSQGSSARDRIYPSVKRWVKTKVPLLLVPVSAQFCVCSRIDISKGHSINHV